MEDTDALLRARARPSLNDLYDEIGYGPFHFRLALAGALGNAADALEVALLTFLSPCAKAAFGVDGALESTLLSVVFAGEFAGAVFWGLLADRYGRRVAYSPTPNADCSASNCSAIFASSLLAAPPNTPAFCDSCFSADLKSLSSLAMAVFSAWTALNTP